MLIYLGALLQFFIARFAIDAGFAEEKSVFRPLALDE